MSAALSDPDQFKTITRPQSGSRQSHGFREKFFSVCLIIYMSTGSIYIFPSGLPQPADFVLALGTLVMLTALRIPRSFSGIILLNTLLALYCLVISAIWVILRSDPSMLLPPMYYIYNVGVFISILLFFSRSKALFFKAMKLAILLATISFILQYAIFADPTRVRQTLGFNNPNQASYFSLCLLTILLVLLYVRQVSVAFFYVVGFVLAYIMMLGFSMTAIAALLLVMGIAFFLTFKATSKGIIIAVFLLPTLGLISGSYVLNNEAFVSSFQRIINLDRVERKLEDVGEIRGYARISELPHLAIFGAGEGGRDRFDDRHRREIHSSVGTILFSYGLFGLFVYLYWHAYALLRGGVICFLIMMVPFIYSLAHQGLRTTLFWILLAMVMIAAFENTRADSARLAMRYRASEP